MWPHLMNYAGWGFPGKGFHAILHIDDMPKMGQTVGSKRVLFTKSG